MNSTLIKISIIGSIAIGIVIGCSSSGDKSSSTKIPLAKVTPEAVATMLDSVAQIDGCEKVVFLTSPMFEQIESTIEASVPLRTYPINSTSVGSCGGSLDISGLHDSGTDTLVYVYNAFCTDYEDRQLISSGSLDVVHKGVPSDLGPIVYEDTISTQGELVEQFHKNDGSVADYNVSMSSYSQRFSDGDKSTSATESNPDTVTIGSAYAIDSDGEKYSASNVTAMTFVESNTVKVVTGQAHVSYPGIGTFLLEADGNLSIPFSSRNLPTWAYGQVMMTGADNTSGAITITEGGVVTVIIDNNDSTAQQVDCSQFLNNIQE